MSKITDRRAIDRPREKLAKNGAENLRDYELLMAIIGSGNKYADVTKIARDVRKLILLKGSTLTYEDLLSIKSLGPAKSAQIMASFELWRRQFEVEERPIIDTAQKAAEQLKDIENKQQEYFVVLTLDGANRLMSRRTGTIGTLAASLVHPREVFSDAITVRATSIIIAHNHPSGNLEASEADKQVTHRIRQAGEILGIELIDHLNITKNGFTSIC